MEKGVYISFIARTNSDTGEIFRLLLGHGRVLNYESDMIYQLTPNTGACLVWYNLIHKKELGINEFEEEIKKELCSNSIDAYVLEILEADPEELKKDHKKKSVERGLP